MLPLPILFEPNDSRVVRSFPFLAPEVRSRQSNIENVLTGLPPDPHTPTPNPQTLRPPRRHILSIVSRSDRVYSLSQDDGSNSEYEQTTGTGVSLRRSTQRSSQQHAKQTVQLLERMALDRGLNVETTLRRYSPSYLNKEDQSHHFSHHLSHHSSLSNMSHSLQQEDSQERRQGRRTVATVTPNRLSSFPVQEEEEIPERREYQAALREAQIGLVESGWRNALKTINNFSFKLFRPKPECVLMSGWLWKLAEYSNVFRRRYTLLLDSGDLLFYMSEKDVQQGKPTEVELTLNN